MSRPAEDGPQRSERLNAADQLRALATVFVVVVHTTHWPHSAALYDSLDLLSRWSVPAFMLLTGVLLAHQYGGTDLHIGPFLQRRFGRSLLPWLVWAPIYAATGWLFTGNVPHTAGDLGTFFSYGAGHLWFLLLIPQVYLLFITWPRRHLWTWAVAAMAVQTGLSVYRLYGPMPTAALEQLSLWHGFQLLPFWVGYFAVGIAAGRALAVRGAPRAVDRRAIALAVAAVALTGWLMLAVTYAGAPHDSFQQGTGAFLLPQEPLFVFSVAALVLVAGPALVSRSRGLAAAVRLLSDHSLGVYILHPLVIYAIGRQLGALLSPGLPLSFLGFLVITVGGLVGATGLSVVLGFTPIARTLGARRRALPRRPIAATG